MKENACTIVGHNWMGLSKPYIPVDDFEYAGKKFLTGDRVEQQLLCTFCQRKAVRQFKAIATIIENEPL